MPSLNTQYSPLAPSCGTAQACILAVDDLPESRQVLIDTLRLAGYQARGADSGEVALVSVTCNPPDLILLDICMQGMNGLEVCRRLKDNMATRHIPIILISGYAEVKDWVQGLQMGASDYISKPFRAEELLTRIKTHLSLSQANLSLAQQAAELRLTNAQLQVEINKRQQVEEELRQNLCQAEQARQEMSRLMEEQRRTEEERAKLQAQLNQAQKMEAIGVLAGGIAHDFNNILGVILGYADMAREDAPPDSLFAKDLERVVSSAHRAKDLVKQILAFSRQSTVDRIPMKLQPIVKESLKLLRASIPSTIAIAADFQSHDGVVLADPTQVHQIVINLCTNAFHAMEQTGGTLSVTLKTVSIDAQSATAAGHISAGEYVVLTVSDTGTGIGPEIIDKIFDPYFTTKEIGRGTGMGLSITHGIISSYHGAITVDSILGQGSTFHVYLPILHEEAAESAESAAVLSGRGRILFVDDEELLVEMGKSMLERLGYEVSTSTGSAEALATFTADPEHFDLVITDQTMPEMTGTDLAIRMLAIRPDLPIILCTGFSQLVNEESAKAIGIREFALKPLSKASIGHLIRKIFNGSQVS